MAKTRKAPRALNVVVALLLASAAVRISSQAGPALAQATQETAPIVQAALNQVDESSFLAALQLREARLDEREARIDEKLQVLHEAQGDLDTQLLALAAAESALQATIAMAETASQSDVVQLKTVYENMKPKEAAALFEEMPPQFAAGFIALMRPDIVASIMTELTPETAYSFSVVLAGRNAGTPTE